MTALQLIALCNRGDKHLYRLISRGDAEENTLLLGGIMPQSMGRIGRIYSITGRFDDHHVARLLDERTTFVESKVQYIGGNWYIAGIGGRDPIANINAVKGGLNEILVGDTKIYLIIVSYFCPYGVCDRSLLGGRRGLHELREMIERYPVRVFISCDCGPGVVEYKGATIVCLGGGSCTGLVDLNNENLSSRVHCGE